MKEFHGSQSYVASEELMRAVNISMVLEKPLLIKGEPGTGKTMLAQAISEAEVFEQIHARMLTIGTRSGSLDAALDRLSANFFDDAILQIDSAIDNIEPALAAFLTVAVGATLISVMMPLIGIMGSIG